MKCASFVSSLFLLALAATPLSAEVPKKLKVQALADLLGEMDTRNESEVTQVRAALEKELTGPNSPFHLSRTSLADYKAGELSVSSLVLQETVEDVLVFLEGRNVELPVIVKYYLKAHKEEELNPDQRILCYLSLKMVQRKFVRIEE